MAFEKFIPPRAASKLKNLKKELASVQSKLDKAKKKEVVLKKEIKKIEK